MDAVAKAVDEVAGACLALFDALGERIAQELGVVQLADKRVTLRVYPEGDRARVIAFIDDPGRKAAAKISIEIDLSKISRSEG